MAQPQQQAQRGKRRDSWLVQYLWPLLSLLVPILMFGLLAWWDYGEEISNAERDVARSTETFFGHAVNVFQTHELAAEAVNERLRGMSWDEIGESRTLQAYLNKLIADNPQIQSIWLADATGRVRSAGGPLSASPVSVADRDYFKALRERDGGTAIGELVQAPALQGWDFFSTARRRGSEGGAFDGAIIVTIFTSYFGDFWSQGIRPGRNAVTLVRGDGKFLARLPVIHPMPASIPAGAPLLKQIRNANQGYFRTVSATDGVERLLGFRRLPRHDVFLVYGMDIRVALADWREHLRLYGAMFGTAAVALLLFSFLAQQAARQAEMRKQGARLESMVRERTAELGESEERFKNLAEQRFERIQEQDRAASNYARSLIEASLDPLVTISAEGKITDVNEATVKATGVPRESLLGTEFSNYFTAPQRARDGYREVFNKGYVIDYPLTMRHRDGKLTDVLYNASIYRDESGAVLGVFAAARDVTALKRAEVEIRAMNILLESRVRERTAQLEAVNMELEAFAYSVSHDLRVPLRAVDGFSSMLEMQFRDALGEEGRRLIGVIRGSAQKMGRLIDDILAFSRMGRKELTRQMVDMGALARSVADELAANRAGRDIQLQVGELPAARGDASMLRQVWVNLISNAIKFTRPRSSVRIDIGVLPGGDGKAGENVYYVRDNGVGFDMQYAHKLFGVFQRLHGVEEFEGTGIGLAIVQRIVARHGGRAWAEGKVNEGATIFFSLPGAESTEAAGGPPAEAPLEVKA